MNRIEFYNRVDRFKEKMREQEELAHAGVDRSNDVKTTTATTLKKGTFNSGSGSRQNNKYYTKIDNYYSDGSARYFYTKDEYDAYLETKKGGKEISKKNDSGRDAAIKNSYNVAQQNLENERLKEEEKKKAIQEEKRRQEEYKKNMEAAQNAEKDRYMGVTKKVEPPKTREQAEKEAHQREQERQSKQSELQTKTREQSEKEAQQREHERQSTQPASPEARRIIQLEDELVKLNGKLNLAKNKEKSKPDVKNRNDIKRLEKEIASKKESIQNLRKKISEKNDSGREAAMKKSYEAEQQRREDAVKTWKQDAVNDVDAKWNEMTNKIKEVYNDIDRNTEFKIDNEITDLLKEAITKRDPKFNGDLTEYLQPVTGASAFGIIGSEWAKKDDHLSTVGDALKEVEAKLKKEINSADYDSIQYGTYLDKIKTKQNENKTRTIQKDLATAKLQLSQIYKGEGNGFKLDKSLMKVLNEKLQEIDATYDGDIESYVRPYLFGKWIKDDVSYNNVKKALEEIENELKTADKHSNDYGRYIQKISTALT